MSVCVQDQCAWVKIEGRADYHCSEALKKLVHGLQHGGCARFLLDFTHCALMDSTFAGTMSRLGREFEKSRGDQPAPSLGVLNANERVAGTLDNLGITHLFTFLEQTAPDARQFRPIDPCPGTADRHEIARTMLDAHRSLVEVNPANFEKFKDVLKFLEEDLRQAEEG